MDEIIRQALRQEAAETAMSKDDRVDLLLNVLTEFLQRQLPEASGSPMS